MNLLEFPPALSEITRVLVTTSARPSGEESDFDSQPSTSLTGEILEIKLQPH